MDKEQAIETLRANYPDACYEQLREAVDAAIEALKAQDAARDLISRQAAIDAAESAYVRNMFPTPLIREIPPVEPGQQWIPVSERLPEEPGYYITSNEYNGVGEDFYYDGHFWNADKNAYSVIAWMPKPKAYKPSK